MILDLKFSLLFYILICGYVGLGKNLIGIKRKYQRGGDVVGGHIVCCLCVGGSWWVAVIVNPICYFLLIIVRGKLSIIN